MKKFMTVTLALALIACAGDDDGKKPTNNNSVNNPNNPVNNPNNPVNNSNNTVNNTTGELDMGANPEIVSMSITPSTLSVAETGMTDQFFTVTIEVAGFGDEIDLEETRVFIQASDFEATFQNSSIAGNTITLENIATGWFQGQPVGTYDIGATVQSIPDDTGQPTEQVTQLNMATVTVTE